MAPKAKGGAGQKAAQDYVSGLWQQGLDDATVRRRLREDGYKAGRISQLIKATRPAQGQADPAAAASKATAKPAVKKEPSASSAALNRKVGYWAKQQVMRITMDISWCIGLQRLVKIDTEFAGLTMLMRPCPPGRLRG